MRSAALLSGFFCAACGASASTAANLTAPTVAVASTPAPAVHPITPDAPFRASPPSIALAAPPPAPPIRLFRLSNGMRVFFLEQQSPGLLRVGVSVRVGVHAPGAALFATRAMWSGTSGRTYDQIRAVCDEELADSWQWANNSSMGVGVTALGDRPDAAIGLLAEVVRFPSFPAANVLRTLIGATHYRQAHAESPEVLARRILPMALYGWSHPDEEESVLRAEDLGPLSRSDIVAAYEHGFDPSGATIIAAGDATEEQLHTLLERAFGSWKGTGKYAAASGLATVVSSISPRLVVVDRPGSSQAYVLFGGSGPSSPSPDFVPLLFMREWVGGRAERALRGAGFRVPDAQVSVRRPTGDALVEFHAEGPVEQAAGLLREMARQLRSASTAETIPELEAIRARLLTVSRTYLWTLQGETDWLNAISVGDIPLDWSARFDTLVSAAAAADVRRAAAAYLDPERMKVVIVGDWSRLRRQLVELGWGPIELRNGDGTVVGLQAVAGPR